MFTVLALMDEFITHIYFLFIIKSISHHGVWKYTEYSDA